MKKLLFILFIFLSACTGNHFHDGKYEASVFTDANMSWVVHEQIQLDGNEMYYTSNSVVDNSVLSEMKTACVQYSDRIEFKNKNGITEIARIDDNGNLKYGEYTYKRTNEDEPVVKEHDNNEPVSKIEKQEPKKKVPIAERELINSGEKVFVGAFLEEEGTEFLNVYLQGKTYTIGEEGEETLCTGTKRKDGRIIDAEGNETDFKLIKGALYRNKGNTWVKYEDQTCGM